MREYQKRFLKSVIEQDILRFGEFTLKSGRVSPYFFNAGLFNTGIALSLLAQCYADAIVDSGIEYDVLFGPAYKGIPLAAATAQALAVHYGYDKSYCFNRKEAKDHGEGGLIVGAPLEGKVLIIDDVITAGTAVREAGSIINTAAAESGSNTELAGIVIAMDRQERGTDGSSAISAVQEIEREYNTKVISIITLSDIIDFLSHHKNPTLTSYMSALRAYQKQYGVEPAN